ncbi:putative ubiquitin-like-specific protease 1B [Magnolia sinica]|uniref:putative ubiquitin-like-specific protease 1B n=1 Tax=Magnolia sinica TaxID=86752 RepID=UPI002658EC63|nr:putative ubiquitin-like-specific protease 1B [Magnolia sinica]
MPTLRAYRDSKSASERAKLVGMMNNVIAIAKQRGKSHAKEIWYSERVYVPVNHDNSHWLLMVLYPRQWEIIIIDSLVSNALLKYKKMINLMTEALPILFQATGDVTAHEGKTWTAKSMKFVPKQCNGFDCGIFVMKFIDILCNGRTLEGTDMQKFTIHWRKSIAYDCLSVTCK